MTLIGSGQEVRQILDPENDQKAFTCTNKTITVGVTGSDRFQQETVLGVLCDPEVGGTRSQQVRGKFDEDWDTVSLLLVDDETLNGGQRWEWLKCLKWA
jgi:hypothetical protein